jgi:protein-S-isoprenylcysteine O-methyltransferase Ste14
MTLKSIRHEFRSEFVYPISIPRIARKRRMPLFLLSHSNVASAWTRGLDLPPEAKRPISPFNDVAAGTIVWPLMITGVFYWLDTWLRSQQILSYPLNLIGLPLLISGVSLAIWCFVVAFGVPRRPILITWGPWAQVRHPIYLAGIFVNLGVALMLGTVVQLLGSIAYALIDPLYSGPKEERELREAFPDEFEEYSKRTPGWIPRIRR